MAQEFDLIYMTQKLGGGKLQTLLIVSRRIDAGPFLSAVVHKHMAEPDGYICAGLADFSRALDRWYCYSDSAFMAAVNDRLFTETQGNDGAAVEDAIWYPDSEQAEDFQLLKSILYEPGVSCVDRVKTECSPIPRTKCAAEREELRKRLSASRKADPEYIDTDSIDAGTVGLLEELRDILETFGEYPGQYTPIRPLGEYLEALTQAAQLVAQYVKWGSVI